MKIIEVKILEVDIEDALRMIILEEAEVSLEKYSIHVTLEGEIEAVVDQDQIPEQVPIEIELHSLNVRSMITLLKIAQIYEKQKKRRQSRYGRCLT